MAFEALKDGMTKAPMLKLPNFAIPFVVEIDALGIGIGAILQQEGHPVAYLSKLMVGDVDISKRKLVDNFHSSAKGGHSSILATTQRLGKWFYWKGLRKIVKKLVSQCDVCQRNKADLAAYNLLARLILFTILEAQPSETRVLLCKAAQVVMEKGFDLLGITPKFSKGLTSYLRQQTGKAMAIRDHYISYTVSRKNPSSRFELFSMFISVARNDFEMGELFGSITISDTCGLLSHGLCKVDAKGCGHVAHFNHDFDNSVGIRDSCFLPFGNPGLHHSVAFSDSIKMGVHLSVTTKKKDACYQLCSCDYDIELGDFWDGTESVKRNTFSTRGINGCVSIFYIIIKDVVDTSWSLWYEPEPTMVVPKLHGHIVAYYGDDKDMSYETVMFHIHPCKLEKGYQKLRRSKVAVPANETFKIRAFLQDDDSREVIVDETSK
ncbi:arginine--tRNA ligase, chloroplastic/mitochondrial [Tanacetum coccineum]